MSVCIRYERQGQERQHVQISIIRIDKGQEKRATNQSNPSLCCCVSNFLCVSALLTCLLLACRLLFSYTPPGPDLHKIVVVP